jgi:polyphosphate kinase 2 (PPK2 family)
MAPAQPPQLVLEILSNGGRLDRKVYAQELARLQLEEFLQSCPEFERMVVRSGIVLLNYWFSVSDAEQESRFQSLINDPTRRWQLSPMDLEARNKWESP